MQGDFQALINHDKMPPEHVQLIKAADKISAYLKCQAELKAGNQEFETAAAQLALTIGALEQPEVIFFYEGLCAQLRVNARWLDENLLNRSRA